MILHPGGTVDVSNEISYNSFRTGRNKQKRRLKRKKRKNIKYFRVKMD